MIKVSIITTCKSRLDFLKKSVPFMLDQKTEVPYDVIVVDYGCPQGTFDWCKRYRSEGSKWVGDSKLKCIGVNTNTDEFNLNRAMNIGAKFSKAEYFLFADSDLLLGPDTLQTALYAMANHDYVHCLVEKEAVGVGPFYLHQPCENQGGSSVVRMLKREAFFQLRGYDEGFTGWGWNDTDLHVRANRTGLRVGHCPARVAFLNHTADESVRHFVEKDKTASAAKNMARLKDYDRVFNTGRWGVAGDDAQYYSRDRHWTNPNFIDLATDSSASGGRGDSQSGWQSYVGKKFSGLSILDVGSGHGASKPRLENNGANQVTLFEPAPGYPTDIHSLDDLPNNAFDLVTAFDVLEHIVDDDSFVERLCEISRRYVYFSTPNFRASHCINWFHAREYTPYQLYSLTRPSAMYVSDNRHGNTIRELCLEDFSDSTSPTLGVLIDKEYR